jgi:biofilm PGA synthesis N-glycosyltransferase PgaC
MAKSLRYVLITPARDEEQYIRHTLESMVTQTYPPVRWVVVSDGSTDATDEIVDQYRECHDWIQLIRMHEHRDRNFAAKVHCFNAGFEEVKDLPFDVVGCLDADVSFEPDYFEFLLEKFAENPHLGVAGTPLVEGGRRYNYRFTNIEDVSGPCQLFRWACFEAIGGYLPITFGGIDRAAVTMARMKGWQTRTFIEKTYLHHRAMGTASASRLVAIFRQGREDYLLGGHPAWQVFRCAYQMTRPPYAIRGLCLLVGYCWASLRRTKRPISSDLVQFQRAEQMKRLRGLFRNVGLGGRS